MKALGVVISILGVFLIGIGFGSRFERWRLARPKFEIQSIESAGEPMLTNKPVSEEERKKISLLLEDAWKEVIKCNYKTPNGACAQSPESQKKMEKEMRKIVE